MFGARTGRGRGLHVVVEHTIFYAFCVFLRAWLAVLFIRHGMEKDIMYMCGEKSRFWKHIQLHCTGTEQISWEKVHIHLLCEYTVCGSFDMSPRSTPWHSLFQTAPTLHDFRAGGVTTHGVRYNYFLRDNTL